MKKKKLNISTSGYLETSKDKNNSYNIIPSNIITTDGMAFPIIANGEYLTPNTGEYHFPNATSVIETPAKNGIHIKTKNKGKFTAYKKRTGKTTEEALHSKDPHVRQMANFARNSKKWNHAQQGAILPNELDYPNDVEGYHAALDQYMMQAQQAIDLAEYESYQMPPSVRKQAIEHPQLPDFTQIPSVDTRMQQVGRDLSKPTQNPLQGKKKFNWGQTALTALALTDAVLPQDPIKKPVVQPLGSYNPHPYGVSGSQALAKDGGILEAKKGKKLKKPKMGQYVSKSYEDGGELELAQKGTIITNNPNDPTLKAYNDSLRLHNNYLDVKQKLDNSGYKQEKEISSYDERVEKALQSKILFGLKQEAADMYSVDDLVPWQVNKNLGRQLISTKIKPTKIDNYAGAASGDNVFTWQSNKQGSGNKARYSDDGYYQSIGNRQVSDLRAIADYSNVKPVQPIVYQKPQQAPIKKGQPTYEDSLKLYKKYGNSSPVFKKPVGTPQPQEPKFKRAINPTGQAPNLGIGEGRPTPAAPNMQQANFDMSKPTKFAFTYPDYVGGKNPTEQQKSMYFPDLQSLRSFGKGYGLEPQHGADESWGQILAQNTPENLRKMKKGGKMAYANNGLQIEDNAYTPISDSTLQINGDSHQNGGTDLFFNGQGVEAEAGETFHIDSEGNGIISGNLKNPLTGKKFKQDSKMIAKKEKKVDKLLDYSTELVNTSNPHDKWDALKFNAGEAMMIGAHLKKQELQRSREHLTALQEAMLDLKFEGEENSSPKKEARNEAKNGLRIDYTDKAQLGRMLPFIPTRKSQSQELPTVSLDAEQVQGNNTLSVAQRHNNPGNMKYEPWMSKFGATPGNPDNITKDGTTYAQFPDMQAGMTAMREKLFNRPTFSKLDLKTAINKWTGGHPYANIPNDLAGKKLNQMTPEEKERAFSVITMGEDSKMYNRIPPGGTAAKPESQTYIPQDVHFNPLQAPTFGTSTPNISNPQTKQPYNYNWNLNKTPDVPVGTDAEGLQFQQILPEIYAATTNKQEPVWMQQYNPQLYQDFEISLQDRRNQITSQGRASRQYLGDNAGAQAILAAGEYDAINNVGAEEFRINQQISNDITNKNITLLNDAQTTNLKLADQQYTRQALGKSKTKSANQTILNSLSNKVLQNQLENRTLQVYENLYPHFRYDENYQQEKVGPGGGEYLNTGGFNPQPNPMSNTSTQQTFDKSGDVKFTRTNTPGAMSLALKKLEIENRKKSNIQSLFKKL